MKTKLLTATVLALSLSACGALNKENYDQLSVGMEYNKVIDILGSPDNCEVNMLKVNNCTWGDDSKYIKVSFAFEKATVFSQKGL